MTGAQLKAWRHMHGLSQTKAAEILGVTNRSIYRWEATPRQEINATVAKLIAYIDKDPSLPIANIIPACENS